MSDMVVEDHASFAETMRIEGTDLDDNPIFEDMPVPKGRWVRCRWRAALAAAGRTRRAIRTEARHWRRLARLGVSFPGVWVGEDGRTSLAYHRITRILFPSGARGTFTLGIDHAYIALP